MGHHGVGGVTQGGGGQGFALGVDDLRSLFPLGFGAPSGLVRTRMPSAVKTASKALLNLESRSRSTNLTVVTQSAMSH